MRFKLSGITAHQRALLRSTCLFAHVLLSGGRTNSEEVWLFALCSSWGYLALHSGIFSFLSSSSSLISLIAWSLNVFPDISAPGASLSTRFDASHIPLVRRCLLLLVTIQVQPQLATPISAPFVLQAATGTFTPLCPFSGRRLLGSAVRTTPPLSFIPCTLCDMYNSLDYLLHL
ncbi:hypothetical protein BD779DRAFT_1557788, partial [Infundibulicybe gibba]